jgi:hypothetical protein
MTSMVVAVAAACVIACGGGRPASATVAAGPASADTVLGTIQLVGTDAFPQVILVPEMSGISLKLIGPPALQRVDGLQVQLAGQLAGDKFTVRSFQVIAANGQPAIDGRLVLDGGMFYIVTQDGERHRLIEPSPNLRAHLGARVWVSGPSDREPVAYGVIE